MTDPDTLTDQELRLLVDAAVAVLAGELGEDERDRLLDLPPGRAAAELRETLTEAGATDPEEVLAALTTGTATARTLVAGVLVEPAAAEPIRAAYAERKSLMALDAGLVTGPVLLALVLLRIKRVRLGKGGLDIQFADSPGVGQLFDLLRGKLPKR